MSDPDTDVSEESDITSQDDVGSESDMSDSSEWSEDSPITAEQQERMGLQQRIDREKRVLVGIEDQLRFASEQYQASEAESQKARNSRFTSKQKRLRLEAQTSELYQRMRELSKAVLEQANIIRSLQGRPGFRITASNISSVIIDEEKPMSYLALHGPLTPSIEDDPLGDAARTQGFSSRRPSYRKAVPRQPSRYSTGLQSDRPRDARTGRFLRVA